MRPVTSGMSGIFGVIVVPMAERLSVAASRLGSLAERLTAGHLLVQREDGAVGDAYHIVNGSTVILDKGYHPCVAAPGYEMYYFTILGGLSQRPLVQEGRSREVMSVSIDGGRPDSGASGGPPQR